MFTAHVKPATLLCALNLRLFSILVRIKRKICRKEVWNQKVIKHPILEKPVLASESSTLWENLPNPNVLKT